MTTEPQPTPAAAQLPRSTVGGDAPAPQPALDADLPAPAELAPGATGTQPAPTVPDPAAPPQAAAPAAAPPLKIKRTRISGLWVALGFFAVVLLLLLIFILQNGAKVDISYMGAHGHLPLGVALLLAAVCGVLLVILAGAARISQLRTVARRHRRADKKNAQANASANSAR
jgi:lipopolysaccharide assembly protein A